MSKPVLIVQFNETGEIKSAQGHHFAIDQNETTLGYALKNIRQDNKGVFISRDIQDWVKLGPYSLGDMGKQIRWNQNTGAEAVYEK